MRDVPPNDPPKTADDRSTTFQAVEPGKEQYNGNTLLVTAYVLVWALVLGYVVVLWRKQAALGARLAGLESAIVRAEKKLGDAPKA